MPKYSIRIMRFDKVYDSFFECDGDNEEQAIEKLKNKITDAGLCSRYCSGHRYGEVRRT